MVYQVLITPVQPSIEDRPNYSGILASYDIEAGSETEAGDTAFIRFCQENPYRSRNRDDYTINIHK